jgi:hypothetical protein
MLIDANDEPEAYMTDRNVSTLDAVVKDVYGEVIFHSGDIQNVDYDDKDYYPGCFRTKKIKVYAAPLTEKELEVNWFGYFNVMMLMMFAKYGENCERQDITSKDTFIEFYPYTLKFCGELG